jgi:hypothetical protein
MSMLHQLHDPNQVGGVREVAIVQNQFEIPLVRILVKVIDTVGVEHRSAALDAVNLVAFLQQELGQIGAILPGDSRNESFLCHEQIQDAANR